MYSSGYIFKHRSALRQRQRGATFLGTLTIISILLFAVYGGIRLVPLYKEFMDVTQALTQASKELSPSSTPAEIRMSLQRRWLVDDIKSVQPKDIQIGKLGNATTLRAAYRAEAEFIGNVSLVVDFDKQVSIGGAAIP